MTNPKLPDPPRVHVAEVIVDSTFLVQLANAMLNTAELHRRRGMQTFPSPPEGSGHPDDDWAIACVIISRAQAHLDEALPGGQRVRTESALGAMRLGVKLLTAALESRGVAPARMSNLPPVEEPANAATELPQG